MYKDGFSCCSNAWTMSLFCFGVEAVVSKCSNLLYTGDIYINQYIILLIDDQTLSILMENMVTYCCISEQFSLREPMTGYCYTKLFS